MQNKQINWLKPYLHTWVAMPAWSQPGTHNTLQPFIRLLQENTWQLHFSNWILLDIVQHKWALWLITIEPESLRWPLSEHGPGEVFRSHWEEEYTWRRSDPQHGGTPPAQHHHTTPHHTTEHSATTRSTEPAFKSADVLTHSLKSAWKYTFQTYEKINLCA